MANNKPIFVVEDDPDDQYLLNEIFEELKWADRVVFFHSGEELLTYLRQSASQPLFILCDRTLPTMTGLALRRAIITDPELQYKGNPFIMISENAPSDVLDEAFHTLGIHGYFLKEGSLGKMRDLLKLLIDYWTLSSAPVKKDKTNSVA